MYVEFEYWVYQLYLENVNCKSNKYYKLNKFRINGNNFLYSNAYIFSWLCQLIA